MTYYTTNTVRIYASLQNVDGVVWENSDLGRNGDTRFPLPDKSIKAILSFKKNGTAYTSTTSSSPGATEYYFLEPKYIVINATNAPSAETDIFHCTFDHILSDTYIETIGDGVDNIIDLYLSKKYELPFASTPPVIGEIANRLTAYEIYYRERLYDRGHMSEFSNKFAEDKRKIYKMLEDISLGIYSLIDGDGALIDWIRNFPYSTASGDQPFIRFWGTDGLPDQEDFLDDIISDYESQYLEKTFDEL